MTAVLFFVFAVTAQLSPAAPPSPPQNFRVFTSAARFPADQVRRECEAWRAKLIEHWALPSPAQWNPLCDVYVHADRAAYRAAVGQGSDATLGSSGIEFQGKAVKSRRLDLLPDARGRLSALGHELTHVLLADCFQGRQPPRWFDEGIAVLADEADKQDRHLQDAATAVAARNTFSIAELMSLDRYPGAGRMGAFYGQSVSLTLMLTQHAEPARLVPFMQHAFDHGYDDALRKAYAINGVAALQPMWHRHQIAARSYAALRTQTAAK